MNKHQHVARPASAFVRDEFSTDSGVRCTVHDVDWDVCGCYCEGDRLCEACGEWSVGLHETPTSCVWCGRPFEPLKPVDAGIKVQA